MSGPSAWNRSSTAPDATAVSIFGKSSANPDSSRLTVTLAYCGSLFFHASITDLNTGTSGSVQQIRKLIVTASPAAGAAGAAVAAGAAGAAVGALVVGAPAPPHADRISAAAKTIDSRLLRVMEDLSYKMSTSYGRMSNTDPSAIADCRLQIAASTLRSHRRNCRSLAICLKRHWATDS